MESLLERLRTARNASVSGIAWFSAWAPTTLSQVARLLKERWRTGCSGIYRMPPRSTQISIAAHWLQRQAMEDTLDRICTSRAERRRLYRARGVLVDERRHRPQLPEP